MSQPRRCIYWMKKDFRVTDNPALIYALDHFDEVLPCFIIEPSWISAPETSAFHIQAIAQAVNELSQRFSAIGKQLLILNDEVVPAIEQLNAQFPISAIVAHEEIGTLRTFKRDIAVSQWSKANGINFHEVIQTGVFRRLKNRNERHELWSAFTFGEITRSPKVGELEQKLAAPLQASNQLKQISIEEFGFQAPSLLAQKVSESAALQTLDEFLHQRGIEYSGGIPVQIPHLLQVLGLALISLGGQSLVDMSINKHSSAHAYSKRTTPLPQRNGGEV